MTHTQMWQKASTQETTWMTVVSLMMREDAVEHPDNGGECVCVCESV